MKLKLIDKGASQWHIHTEEGDVHVAYLAYLGSGQWSLSVADLESRPDVNSKFAAVTVDDAFAIASDVIALSPLYVYLDSGPTVPVGQTVGHKYSEKAMLLNSVLQVYFQSFCAEGANGANEFLNVLSSALGNAIAMISPEESELVISGAGEVMRETIRVRMMLSAEASAARAAGIEH